MSRNGSVALRLARQLAARGCGSGRSAAMASASAAAMPLFDVTGASIARLAGGLEVPFALGGLRGISASALQPSDRFCPRHNSPTENERAQMLEACGYSSLEDLVKATVPASIVRTDGMEMGQYTQPMTESDFLSYFKKMASKNVVNKTYIGMGYYDTIVPPVILRNVLENPGWYTQYTPYQAEISQGRLESLLNFQTMVTDLTAMPLSNSSLLDEATAAAEGMTMCSAIARGKKPKFLISSSCHPQTIAVVSSRADGLGLEAMVMSDKEIEASFSKDVCGALVQYPATDGTINDYSSLVGKAHEAGSKVVVATDLLALTKLKPPGEWGADIVVGSAQRFGVPMGYGGPHAAFLATSEDYKRLMPGRVIGVSVDATGAPALRMAMQTREQHIRRDKATSNICTAQALLANMAAMYAVYHGPAGLDKIATRVNGLASILATGASKMGMSTPSAPFFDTVTIGVGAGKAQAVLDAGYSVGINLRMVDADTVSVAVDETTKLADLDVLFGVLSLSEKIPFTAESLAEGVSGGVGDFARQSKFLQQPIFNIYHSEHEMLRYLKRLENKDLSLVHSMIALGSCTMKLNSTSEMIPVTWPELGQLHPFCPKEQAQGYEEMFQHLAMQLCTITGFDAMSLQPNAGAAGEYAGLMSIRSYHRANGDHQRNICIIPVSAHGTNPASAVMAGMKIVTVGTDAAGNIDMADFRAKVEANKANLAALMITYPSTHGVYEEGVDTICQIIHDAGGQVYMDGANMNAQVGLTSPGHIGADVCHLNLHKTFCIPHGGGGPGMGPIGVKAHLAPFLPSHPVSPTHGYPKPEGELKPFGVMAAAPYGSSSILAISYAYITMMGSKGLKEATSLSILNANYMAARLQDHYTRLFKGKNGTNAHEFILDTREFKEYGVEVEDIAKRMIDYGFHAPTMSWPVPGTLMIEPTESESKAELDRFVNTLISIREEIRKVERGEWPADNNPLVNAPHTAAQVMADTWDKPYSREVAAFPADWVKQAKFWPTTARVDNVYGDRHLVTKLPAVAEAMA